MLLAVFATAVITTVVHNKREHKASKPAKTVTIALEAPTTNTPAGDKPTTVTIPVEVAKEAAATEAGHHEGLKTEVPPGVASQEIEAARQQQDELAANDQLPIVTPDAAPSQRGCTSRFVRNYSSRRGVRPRLLVTHYTVSPNRPGWDDVWGIVNLFNTPAFAASSNYVVDGEGHCAYIVRESDKAWTQATANPVSISIEVINTGKEKILAPPAGLKKIGEVWSDAARRWAIPLQAGKISGCRVVRSGIIDHYSIGACGGGHFDVSPYGVAAIIAAAKNARRPITAVDRTRCRKLNFWRSHGQPGGKAVKQAVRQRKALESRQLVCTARGLVRR